MKGGDNLKQAKIASDNKISAVILNQVLNGRRDIRSVNSQTALKIASILGWPLEKVIRAKAVTLKKRFINLYEV